MKEYIEGKIRQIEQEVNPGYYLQNLADTDYDLKRRWKTEKSINNEKWRKISSNADIFSLIDLYDGTVRFVEENVKYGHVEDGFNMMLALYNVLQGFRKLAQFVDSTSKPWNNTSFEKISEMEVDQLFKRIDSIIVRMNAQNMRRMMQD